MPPLPLDVPLGLQEPQILLMPADVHSLDVAREAIDLANAYGGNLDRAQEIALETCMATTKSNRWAAATFGNAVPRQNGKGDSIQWRELYGATQLNERIAHTAHETPTAIQAFQRMESLIQENADLRRLVKRFRYANGEQAVEFKSGAFIIYRTRTGSGLRGWDEIDLLVVDEAQHAQEEHLAAIAPTQTVAANPQTYFAGSAGFSSSIVWWRMRLDAIRGNAGPFGWVEHTAERVSLDGRGRLISGVPDPTDETAWAMANPAYGHRIGGGGEGSRRYVDAELRKLGPALFLRERLGVWDALPQDTSARPVKLPADAWAATVTYSPPAIDVGEIVLSFDVAPGGEWASIAIAAGTLGDPYVELIEHQAGTGWLPDRLLELVQRWQPTVVVCDGVGPAGATVAAVLLAFRQAGISADLLHQVTFTELKRACGAFFADVVEGRLKRPANQGPLDNAAADATERQLGEAWAWDRRNATVPISPLVAVTLARSMLSTEPAINSEQFDGGFVDLADFLED